MRTDSSLFEQFTLGIEEEFQLVDPNTRELRSHVYEILEEGRMLCSSVYWHTYKSRAYFLIGLRQMCVLGNRAFRSANELSDTLE